MECDGSIGNCTTKFATAGREVVYLKACVVVALAAGASLPVIVAADTPSITETKTATGKRNGDATMMVFFLHGCSTGKWNGAVVNVTSQTATSEDFDITGSIPTSAFQVDLTVQAGKNVSIGDHPVTLTGISIQTSKGEGYGNTDTEDFDVEKLAVDISGPPYVIIDNSTLYDNSPVDSTYTASVQGSPDPLNMAYEWTISPNINNLSTLSGAPNTLPVDGAGPEGAGNITCVAYSNGTNQSGSKQVTVQDEYVVEETSSNVPGQMSSPLLAQFGPFNNGGTTAAKVQVSQSKTVSQTVTVGFTESAGAADGPIEAKFGLSASTSATISGTISVDTTLTVPPMTSDTLQEFPSTDTDTGTYQIWGISGLLQSGTWVYVQLAPGPMPAAQTIVQEPYSP